MPVKFSAHGNGPDGCTILQPRAPTDPVCIARAVNGEGRLRLFAYITGLLGVALFIVLLIRADVSAVLKVAALAGWALLWVIPYRGLYFLLYAMGWRVLLRAYDPLHRARMGFLMLVTALREAIDRLLPVASVGGGVVGIRLLRWRGLPPISVGVTVIAEVILTLWASYLFALLGLLLAMRVAEFRAWAPQAWIVLVCLLPVPVAFMLLVRNGSVFSRLQQFIKSVVGIDVWSEGAAALDSQLRRCLSDWRSLLLAGTLQLAALVSGSFEIWLVLRLFGHPVDSSIALILESATQTVRHVAFFVPGALGVQEAGLVLLGHAVGVGAEVALAVSLVKRAREVICGLPPLIWWQWLEAQRLRDASPAPC